MSQNGGFFIEIRGGVIFAAFYGLNSPQITLFAVVQGPSIKCPHFKNMITSKPVSVGNPNVLITLLDILSFVG